MDGGYDSGYKACPCFWGKDPGKLVRQLAIVLPTLEGLAVLDAGCGEGKNAEFFASHGAIVTALDISELAISHAKTLWASSLNIKWYIRDIADWVMVGDAYHIVVAYGLLHCLRSRQEIADIVVRLQRATKPGGFQAVVALNGRLQDLRAHPELNPCLISHSEYLDLYRGWDILSEEDVNLTETHPHNQIRHTHALTRILVRKPA